MNQLGLKKLGGIVLDTGANRPRPIRPVPPPGPGAGEGGRGRSGREFGRGLGVIGTNIKTGKNSFIPG